jgi:hypothetical protein
MAPSLRRTLVLDHLLPTHLFASAARCSSASLTVDAATAVATKYVNTRILCGYRQLNRAPSDALRSYRRRNATTVLRLAAGADQIRRSRPLGRRAGH